jgi:hypothetical protein
MYGDFLVFNLESFFSSLPGDAASPAVGVTSPLHSFTLEGVRWLWH